MFCNVSLCFINLLISEGLINRNLKTEKQMITMINKYVAHNSLDVNFMGGSHNQYQVIMDVCVGCFGLMDAIKRYRPQTTITSITKNNQMTITFKELV